MGTVIGILTGVILLLIGVCLFLFALCCLLYQENKDQRRLDPIEIDHDVYDYELDDKFEVVEPNVMYGGGDGK